MATQEETTELRKKAVSAFLENGILLSHDLLDAINSEGNKEALLMLIKNAKEGGPVCFDLAAAELIKKNESAQGPEINWEEIERCKAEAEKKRGMQEYSTAVSHLIKGGWQETNRMQGGEPEPMPLGFMGAVVETKYTEKEEKKEVQDFVSFFNKRLSKIGGLLKNRPDLQNPASISRLLKKPDKEAVSVLGVVSDKNTTKNNNIVLKIEDTTGEISVIINKNKPDLLEAAGDIVLDETIGISGVVSNGRIFANAIIWPDIATTKELKKSQDEVYAAFLSDLHVGSNKFLKDKFDKFIRWINGKAGDARHREIAEKTKYIFIAGDLIDGVGVYPEQDSELDIKDVFLQYEECAALLSQIPKDKTIIVCPGNHDAMRIAEPQPLFYKDIAKPIWALGNVVIAGNPAYVNIHASNQFPGFDVLLYHGYSFDYYISNVDSIRAKGGYDRPDLIMKFLLKRRHLAPTYGSTLLLPDPNNDALIIDKVPDFFVTGHLHKTSLSNYRNVTLICGSCWQSKTAFQEKVGHHPEPGRVPLVNLQTREGVILKF